MSKLSLNVNGSAFNVEAESSTPLVFVLRNELQLLSPRLGCGLEQCGACKVLIDGSPEFSCTLAVSEVAGREVTTVEGLNHSQKTKLHPLQQAFLEMNAAQCGYCASGIIIAAAALLARNNAPDREEIKHALATNLCRCGAHNRVIKAVERAALLMRDESASESDG